MVKGALRRKPDRSRRIGRPGIRARSKEKKPTAKLPASFALKPKSLSAGFKKPVMVARSIVVSDPMRPVLDPTISPYASICAIGISDQHSGTGFVVAPNIVLTAGHVIAEANYSQISDFTIRFPGTPQIYRIASGEYADHDNPVAGHPNDLILLRLQGSLSVPPLRYAGVGSSPSVGATLEVAGYPINPGSGQTMYSHSGKLVSVSPGWLNYQVNTLKGQSGSPVLISSGGVSTAVGVHDAEPSAASPVNANRGIKLRDDLIQWIGRYVNAA